MSTEGHERMEAPDNRPALEAVEYDGWVTFAEEFTDNMEAWVSVKEGDTIEAVDLVRGD